MQYRAKRKSDRSWTEGALIPYGDEPKIIHAISVHPEFTDSENVYYCEGSPVDPDTVCRFTGMYDITDWDELTSEEQALFLYPEDGSRHHRDEWRGKKIYENDIVRVTDDDGYISELNSDTGLGRVVFCFGMWYIINGIENSLFEISSGYHVRVIGNAYDNPDLLASLNHDMKECWMREIINCRRNAAEVFHGKWEWVDDEECGIYRCSCCDQGSGYPTNHCPNCGATMDGGNAGMRMDRCKDCIHFGICKKGFPFADGNGGGWCEDFKRKANYVEVVLCEDCKNSGQCSIQDAMNWTPKITIGDSFCSYGERREGE